MTAFDVSRRGQTSGGLEALAQAIGQIGFHVASLRERIRLLEAVMDNFPGGISLFDENLRLVLVNKRQIAMLEYPDHLFRNGPPTMEELFRFNAARGEYGSGSVEEHVERRIALVAERRPHVYERIRPNGTVLEIRGAPIAGGGFVTTYLDVTEQRRTQALIAHMAHHDQLTNLPNRILFNDRFAQALARVAREGALALHFIDIDGFKPINDTLGHDAGDQLLIAIAERMRAAVRENDTVARLGGDEFAIVQTGIRNANDSEVLARRIVSALAEPFSLAGKSVKVGASIGVALAPADGSEANDLMRMADFALYKSKAGGRGTWSFYRTEPKRR